MASSTWYIYSWQLRGVALLVVGFDAQLCISSTSIIIILIIIIITASIYKHPNLINKDNGQFPKSTLKQMLHELNALVLTCLYYTPIKVIIVSSKPV